MNSINFFVITFILLAFSGTVYSRFKSGHITEKSHPMLASLFSVVDDIRKLQPQQTGQKLVTSSGHPSNGNGIAKPTTPEGAQGGQKDLDKLVTVGNPVSDTTTDLSQNLGLIDFPNPGIGLLLDPEVPRTATTSHKFGIGGAGGFVKPVDSGKLFHSDASTSRVSDLAGDMLCSLCRQRGDAECIAIHCWNDGSSSVPSGSELPPLESPPVPDTLPMLSDTFDFRNQIDRHDLLQLTNINSSPEQSSIDMNGLKQLSLSPESPPRETTAPIWLLSDRLVGTAPTLPLNTVPDLQGSIDLFSVPGGAENTSHVGVVKNPLAVNDHPTSNIHPGEINENGQVRNPGIVFTDGSLGSPVPLVVQQTGTAIHWNEGLVDIVNNQPLDIPTDILIQLLRKGEPPFSQNLDTTTNVGNPTIQRENSFIEPTVTDVNSVKNKVSNGIPLIPVAIDVFANNNQDTSMGFPPGFVEENATDLSNNIDTVTSLPHIPTAGDVFPAVRKEMNPTSKQTLVIKERGNTEKVAVLVGNGPVLNNGISLLETRGQNTNPKQTNVQPVDLHSLTHSAHENSHQNQNHQHLLQNPPRNLNHQHSPEHSDQKMNHRHSPIVNINIVQMNEAQEGVNVIDNVDMNDLTSQVLSTTTTTTAAATTRTTTATTTPIPTIDPVRKSELQNWSKQFLTGVRL